MADRAPAPGVTVRRATAADADAVAALNADVQALHAALLPGRFKPPGAGTLGAAEARALIAAPSSLVLVAEADGAPAGYAYAEVRRRPESAYAWAYDEVYVHHLSVAPAHRRRGVGRALLSAVAGAGRALGIERLALDVWAANEAAAAFFRAQGFAPENARLARGGPTLGPR